jgi:EmrB/QacA subfamily drug resistance transporter
MTTAFPVDAAQVHAAVCPTNAKPAGPGILACTILASGLAFVDGSVVNVGLPAIGQGLHAGAGDLSWVINAYLLPLGALLLLGGAAGDRYGRRNFLILGTALFGFASLFAALAPSLAWLLTGRTLQGVGAALLLPNSLAILGAAYSGEARGRAIGIWAAAGAVMGAVGPVLGGWLIDAIGWRAIFYITLPAALAAILMALAYVKQTDRTGRAPPLDAWGSVLATASLGAITWGLTLGTGPAGWTSDAIISCVAGAILALAFLWAERARGDDAMMPLSLFGSSSFIGLTLLTWFLYAGLGALMVLVPYVLIVAAGWSGVAAGAALMPFTLVLALMSPVMGGLAGRIGPRPLLSLGCLVTALGFLLLAGIRAPIHYWTDAFPGILVVAIGMSGAVAPLTSAVLSAVDGRHIGSASGLNSAVARTAGMVATALLAGVLGMAGEPLLRGFDRAMIASAAAALAASASAFFLIRIGRNG